jgi:GNAT superfamily N-acetyltransferase
MAVFMLQARPVVNDAGLLSSLLKRGAVRRDMVAFKLRKLDPADAHDVAHVLRTSFDERLPWLAGLHTPEEDRAFVRGHLFETCELWGAHEADLVGMIAFAPGWVEQLYILPGWQGRGVGKALLDVAKARNTELRLWTFQRNIQARRFYERQGFVAIDETDGAANEEREPDVLYRWLAEGSGA